MFKLLRPRAKSLSSGKRGGSGGGGGSVEKLVLCKPSKSNAGSPKQKQGRNKSNLLGFVEVVFLCGCQKKTVNGFRWNYENNLLESFCFLIFLCLPPIKNNLPLIPSVYKI